MKPAQIARFLGVFSLVFVILTWPGLPFGAAYMGVFRAVGSFVFTHEGGKREVLFVESPRAAHNPTLARIEITNRDRIRPDGSGPVRLVDFDASKLAWQPCAFLIALVVATPVPWSRRLRSLAWGLLGVHMVIVLCLAFVIWRESAAVGLVSLPPFWADLAAKWQLGFVTLLSLTCPVVIWVPVMFRAGDNWNHGGETQARKPERIRSR